jgi:hemerythrin-like domain-containing protein
MSIQIGAAPESSFENPLGLLSDCHRRIERFLKQLTIVTEQAKGGPLDETQQHALEVALRYFREAAPRHTRDEEDSLFPRLRKSEDPSVHEALATIEKLESDHDTADAGHAEIDAIGNRWLEAGTITPEETARLHEVLSSLQTLYQRHIAVEDNELFPSAAKALSESEIADIGLEMAARRGLDLSKIPDMKLRCPTKRLM